jgi:hypothetical protein
MAALLRGFNYIYKDSVYQIKFDGSQASCPIGTTNYTGFWWGNLRERDHLGDPGVDDRIILRWIFRKWEVEAWTVSSWLRIGTGGGQL